MVTVSVTGHEEQVGSSATFAAYEPLKVSCLSLGLVNPGCSPSVLSTKAQRSGSVAFLLLSQFRSQFAPIVSVKVDLVFVIFDEWIMTDLYIC